MTTNILTKSLFAQALTCPTKLYYATNPGYVNTATLDPFLEALADGGFQVGALARAYYPQGIMIDQLDQGLALEQTAKLLEKDEVVIFEAALKFGTLFVRVDILHKHDGIVELIEVKAKSYNANNDTFLTNKNTVKRDWKGYFYDLAFQKYVADRALDWPVFGYLMLVDKNAVCPVDGLNQKFQLEKQQGQTRVAVGKLNRQDLEKWLLVKVAGNDICNLIYDNPVTFNGRSYEFEAFVEMLKNNLLLNTKISMPLSKACQKCEYRPAKEKLVQGGKHGFNECWKEQAGLSSMQLEKPLVIDIWNFLRKDELLNKGVFLMEDVPEDYFGPFAGDGWLSNGGRHHLQVAKVKDDDNTPFVVQDGLHSELAGHRYPLHFIDFETAMVPIPFTKGRHPYEGIAFQFSHHIMNDDGSFEHFGEFLDAYPGHFPNFDFLRELKRQLENDNGTIFRYATHENTYLNMIHSQLQDSQETDRDELCAFIESITHSISGSLKSWKGHRDMVDLCEIIKKYHYDPATKGSVSIKYVLPAFMNSSKRLKQLYSTPIYGSERGIRSHNFRDFTWYVEKDGKVMDPYTLLPAVFDDLDLGDLERLSEDEYLKNGGAALMAYNKMQFTDMSKAERDALEVGLLKYCELDTLAMVMVYQGLRELVEKPL